MESVSSFIQQIAAEHTVGAEKSAQDISEHGAVEEGENLEYEEEADSHIYQYHYDSEGQSCSFGSLWSVFRVIAHDYSGFGYILFNNPDRALFISASVLTVIFLHSPCRES